MPNVRRDRLPVTRSQSRSARGYRRRRDAQFGRFHVAPGSRSLLRDGRPIAIGGRAFDLLVLLLRSRGALVSKAEIVNHVWPSTLVDESNLRFQMMSLRKALGEDRGLIKTIPGRGYLLAQELVALDEDPAALEDGAASQDGSTKQTCFPPPGHDELNDLQRPTVAIIDDDPAVCEAIKGLLYSVGFDVEAYELASHVSRRAPTIAARMHRSGYVASWQKRARVSIRPCQGQYSVADHIHQRACRRIHLRPSDEGRRDRVFDQAGASSRSGGRHPARYRDGVRPCCATFLQPARRFGLRRRGANHASRTRPYAT